MVVLARMIPPRARTFCMLALLPFTFPNHAISQQTNNNRCRVELIRRGSSASEIPQDNACFVLGVAVVDAMAANAWLEPRDIQPSGAGNATPAGTPAQSSAVPTVQPTAVAAAAFAAVAQDSGAESITSISINPATLFSSEGDVQGLARLARLADITVFFPVSSLDHNKDGKIDYAGARARINFTAGAQASTFLTRVNDALLGILRSELTLVNRVDSLLQNAPDPAKCARQLMGESASAGTLASCGAEPSLLIDERRYAEFRQA